MIYIAGLVPLLQEMRGDKLNVAPAIDLVAPYSQKTDSDEQQLDLAKLHAEVGDSHIGTSMNSVSNNHLKVVWFGGLGHLF